MTTPTSAEQPAQINDRQWSLISPLVLGGITAQPDERSDLRAAINALLWTDQNPGQMPEWVTSPSYVQAIHTIWHQNGTAANIRRLIPKTPEVTPKATNDSQVETTKRQPTAKTQTSPSPKTPTMATQPETAAPETATDRPPPEPSAPSAERPNPSTVNTTKQIQHQEPATPRPTAPPTSESMIRHMELWVAHHYFSAHISGDWFEADLGRHFLTPFKHVLDLMYTHWEVENDRNWPHPRLFEPMPDNDWMSRTKRSLAICIATENIQSEFDGIRHAINDLQEIVIRGTPYQSNQKEPRDRIVRIQATNAIEALGQLQQTVEKLQNTGVAELQQAKLRELQTQIVNQYPIPTQNANPTSPIAPNSQPPQRSPMGHQKRAIAWAETHDGKITPKELAQHMVDHNERPPQNISSLTAALTNAITRSTRFRKTGKAIYELTEPQQQIK